MGENAVLLKWMQKAWGGLSHFSFSFPSRPLLNVKVPKRLMEEPLLVL